MIILRHSAYTTKEVINMKMGDRIKFLREERNMTQDELGSIIGVQKSAIRKYEKGEVENIKRSSIKKMADAFGVSPCYLMGWDEEENKIEHLAEEVKFIENIQKQYGKERYRFYLYSCN